MAKPTLRFRNTAIASVMQYAEQIIIKMKEAQLLFPAATQRLENVETSLAACRLATSEAAFMDKRAMLLRDEKERELKFHLYELSKYVDTVAHGNATVVLAAGFVPSKTPDRGKPIPPKPAYLNAKPMQLGSGRIRIQVEPWLKARLYQFEYRKRGSTNPWIVVLCSKSKTILEGLQRFQEYEFRVAYIGIDPTVTYSDIVRTYAI